MKLSEKIEQELLENLNEVQKQAVLHEHGPLLILAGAGSGKTRVITHRIAHLIRVRGLRPYRIAAVTFTNKAAQEMKERLSSLIGPMAQDVMVKTFHSLGLYILRRNAAAAGLKSTFTVLDPDAQTSIIKAILKERAIDTSILDTAQAAHAIDRAKDSLITPEEMEKRTDHFSQLIAPVYRSYAGKLLENNSVDFGDL
ncbi:MAG TPA: UvrD-helicase domain-containing protein, partial [Leptospiraceae bacterium]|nr:UvrD-helicase domain-containing protein [Leptospiraceae bacterium]